MPATGDRVGRFEILAPLGSGGMGEVYRAIDTQLNRHVAVKFLAADFATPSGGGASSRKRRWRPHSITRTS